MSDKKSRVCERCFAPVPLTESFCPECGTALVDKADGSDAAVVQAAQSHIDTTRNERARGFLIAVL